VLSCMRVKLALSFMVGLLECVFKTYEMIASSTV
jgi:hypothetical protein